MIHPTPQETITTEIAEIEKLATSGAFDEPLIEEELLAIDNLIDSGELTLTPTMFSTTQESITTDMAEIEELATSGAFDDPLIEEQLLAVDNLIESGEFSQPMEI